VVAALTDRLVSAHFEHCWIVTLFGTAASPVLELRLYWYIEWGSMESTTSNEVLLRFSLRSSNSPFSLADAQHIALAVSEPGGSLAGMPALGTIHRHLGSYQEIYERVGYHTTFIDVFKSEQAEPSQRLRRDTVRQILTTFPENICLTHLPNRTRSILQVDHSFSVSIVLCRTTRQKTGSIHWRVETCVAERENISLVVRLAPGADRVESYHVFPKLTFQSHRSYPNDPWLKTGIFLKNLSQFYVTVRRLHDSMSSKNIK